MYWIVYIQSVVLKVSLLIIFIKAWNLAHNSDNLIVIPPIENLDELLYILFQLIWHWKQFL